MRCLTVITALALAACAPIAQPVPEPVAQPITEPVTESVASPGAKRIALTYDDAPRGDGPRFTGTERTRALLDQWESADIPPVAVFVTTGGMESPEGRARVSAYAKAGHLIANHSDTHMWASRVDTAEYVADLDRAEAALDSLPGIGPNRRAWYRFPYLDEGGYGAADALDARTAKRDALRAALDARGLMSGYVTVDTFDWHLEDLWQDAVRAGHAVDEAALARVYTDMVVEAAAHYDAMALDVLGRRPDHVLLLHENDLAASFTTDMVAALRADGWQIIHPDTAFADPIADILPDTLFSGKGRLAAMARGSGLNGPDVFDHWSTDEAALAARAAPALSVTDTAD